jgi:hypothetical protein
MIGDDRDELRNLAQDLFGTSNIPPTYMRELKRYLGTATAQLGLAASSYERTAYWIDGRSLGVLACTGISDQDLELHPIVGTVIRLDQVTTVNFVVAVYHDNTRGMVTTSGRRLTIGQDVDLDASPGRFLPDKRKQIEDFIDQLLAVVAGR